MQNPTAFWTYFHAFIGHNVFTSCLIWYATSSTPALYTLTCANILRLETRRIHYPRVSRQSELSQLPLLLEHAPSPNQTAGEESTTVDLSRDRTMRWNLHSSLTYSHLPFLLFNQAFANQTALSEKGLAEVLPILTQHNVASADGTVAFVLSELFDALILWNATCWTNKMFRDKARSQWVRNIVAMRADDALIRFWPLKTQSNCWPWIQICLMSSAKKMSVQMFTVEIIDYPQTKTLWGPKFNIVYTCWTSKTKTKLFKKERASASGLPIACLHG